MRWLLAVLVAISASQVHAEDVTFIRQGGDTLELRQGEVFLELVYENSGDTNSQGGSAVLSLNGVKVLVRVIVGKDEVLTVDVPDPGLFPEVVEAEVPDGERIVVQIMPALF